MKGLNGFFIPKKNELALCEIEGKVQCMDSRYANISSFTNVLEKHPNVFIRSDMLHFFSSGDESKALFLQVSQTYIKHLINVWYEQGFTEVLSTIAENPKPALLNSFASFLLKSMDVFIRMKMLFNPYIKEPIPKMLSSLSQTENWSNSIIRCVAWHPHCTKLAVAALDDSVHIYSENSNLVPVLKFKQQRQVTCLAWRPNSASEIAVGCESGVYVWTVDPNSVVGRVSVNNTIALKHRGVVSVAWSPFGHQLVSASALDSTLHVWEVSLAQSRPLARWSGAGNTLLRWSPDGLRLMAAATDIVFKIWQCDRWRCSHWSVSKGRVQTACWSPCGTVLLFATTEEPTLYALTFSPKGSIYTSETEAMPAAALPVLDLTRIEVPGGAVVGGLVRALAWDPHGHVLAALFADCPYVAIFTTFTSPTLVVTPNCLLNGLDTEIPSTIAFQQNFTSGTCLTVAWSSGRLQHFPFLYSELGDTSMGRVSLPNSSYLNLSSGLL